MSNLIVTHHDCLPATFMVLLKTTPQMTILPSLLGTYHICSNTKKMPLLGPPTTSPPGVGGGGTGLKTGVGNYIFWSETGSGFGEPGGNIHQEFLRVPSPQEQAPELINPFMSQK